MSEFTSLYIKIDCRCSTEHDGVLLPVNHCDKRNTFRLVTIAKQRFKDLHNLQKSPRLALRRSPRGIQTRYASFLLSSAPSLFLFSFLSTYLFLLSGCQASTDQRAGTSGIGETQSEKISIYPLLKGLGALYVRLADLMRNMSWADLPTSTKCLLRFLAWAATYRISVQ